MFKLFLFLFIAVYADIANASEDEVKSKFSKSMMSCVKDNPVPLSELANIYKQVVPHKTESKCLLACVYRKIGLLKTDGRFDIDQAHKLAELMKSEDANKVENAKKMTEECIKVNDAEVSDGEKGCDRAALLFKCVVEIAPKYGFKF